MFFQSSAIENGNIASAVTDQLSALQLGRRADHAAAADPQALSQQSVGQIKIGGPRRAARHQKLARQARIKIMNAGADGNLLDLPQQRA